MRGRGRFPVRNSHGKGARRTEQRKTARAQRKWDVLMLMLTLGLGQPRKLGLVVQSRRGGKGDEHTKQIAPARSRDDVRAPVVPPARFDASTAGD